MLETYRGGGTALLVASSLSYLPFQSTKLNYQQSKTISKSWLSTNSGIQSGLSNGTISFSDLATGEEINGDLHYDIEPSKLDAMIDTYNNGVPLANLPTGNDITFTESTIDGSNIAGITSFLGYYDGVQYSNITGYIDLSQTNVSWVGHIQSPFGITGFSEITGIIFPKTLQFIGAGGLIGNTNLTYVVFNNPDPSWMLYDKENMTGINPAWLYNSSYSSYYPTPTPLQTIYVPDESVASYQSYLNDASHGCTWFDPLTMTVAPIGQMPGPGPSPTPSENINLGVALGVSLGICVGIPGIIGLGFLGKYKSRKSS